QKEILIKAGNGVKISLDGSSGVLKIESSSDIAVKSGGKLVLQGRSVELGGGGGGLSGGGGVGASASAGAGTGTQKVSVQQNAAGQSMGSGSPSLSSAGTAASTNAASSQITEAAASTGYQKTLIREVRGAADVFSRQDIEYWVAGYNKEQSEVSKADRNNVRWAVKVDGGVIDVIDGRTGELIRGERIPITILDDWAGKKILVMAYLKSRSEKVSQETRVGPRSQSTLIRMVKGPEEILEPPGHTVKYKVTRYNKDLHDVEPRFRSGIKWAVKVGEKEPEMLNKTGEELEIKTDISWIGKEVIVMPHINKHTEIVSQKTNVNLLKDLGAFKALHSKINTLSGNALCYLDEASQDSLIEVLKKTIEKNNSAAQWVAKNKKEVKILLDKTITREDAPTAALVPESDLRISNNGSKFVIVFNVNKLVKDEVSVEKLQAYFIHELRHLWQRKSEGWEGKLGEVRKYMGKDKFYHNVLTEVDAYDAQFKLEEILGIFDLEKQREIDKDKSQIRHMFEHFEKKSTDELEVEKSKAKYLSTIRYGYGSYGEGNYINPYEPR
ncbi:MAG: hypothetical protein LBU89_07450, partial [Fibromonadaceae bacterium]|nr:hypothetical protein [Fibromonadaceae bacterium]